MFLLHGSVASHPMSACLVSQRCILNHGTQNFECDTTHTPIIQLICSLSTWSQALTERTGNTPCTPNPFNILPRSIKSLLIFKISLLQPHVTQLEGIGPDSISPALSEEMPLIDAPNADPQQAANLSREVIWAADRCLSASQQRVPSY